MPDDYVEPTYAAASFTCPHCGVLAAQRWQFGATSVDKVNNVQFASCQHAECEEMSVWVGPIEGATNDGNALTMTSAQMVFPAHLVGERPNSHLSDSVKATYNEARKVLPVSARAAGALARLALEQLLTEQLRVPGSRINDQIGYLVKKGRIQEEVQRILDAGRVLGNGAVHAGEPGQIRNDESDELARDNALIVLRCINLVATRLISEEAEIDAIWEKVPEAKREQIERRDAGGDDG